MNGYVVELDRTLMKELLDKYDISQKRLSDMTGISESAISRYLSRSRTPTMKNIAKIAWALNVKVDDLISYSDSQQQKG